MLNFHPYTFMEKILEGTELCFSFKYDSKYFANREPDAKQIVILNSTYGVK